MDNLREILEPIAAWFESFGVPKPIVHWGHPTMMGIVVFVVGGFVAFTGWRSRLTTDGEVAMDSRMNHRKMAPWLFLFLALGYIGGVLSLVMQHQDILSSHHFQTGSIVLIILAINGLISLTGFVGNKSLLRTIHAYLGSAAIVLLLIHVFLGLNLGLSI